MLLLEKLDQVFVIGENAYIGHVFKEKARKNMFRGVAIKFLRSPIT